MANPPPQTIAAEWASLQTMQMMHVDRAVREFLRMPFYLGAKALLDIARDDEAIPAGVDIPALEQELQIVADWVSEHSSHATTLADKWSALNPFTKDFGASTRKSVYKAFFCGAKAMFNIAQPPLPAIVDELVEFHRHHP